MQRLEIGQIVNTFGIKGLVKVKPFTDDITRFDNLKNVYIKEKQVYDPTEGTEYEGEIIDGIGINELLLPVVNVDAEEVNAINKELEEYYFKYKGEYYDDERIKEFDNVQFPGKVSEIVLNNERMDMLREIKSIFVAQKTDYRIVISPIYDQVKINPEDLSIFHFYCFIVDYFFFH